MAVLEQYSYVPVPVEDDGVQKHAVFQVLTKTKVWAPRTYDTVDEYLSTRIIIQPLERWNAGLNDEAQHVPGEMNCFVVSDPIEVEITSLAGLDERGYIRTWRRILSDVDGCFALCDPQPLRVPMASLSNDAPVPCLLDELQRTGFSGVEHIVDHCAEGPKMFDVRESHKKHCISLQCCGSKNYLGKVRRGFRPS